MLYFTIVLVVVVVIVAIIIIIYYYYYYYSIVISVVCQGQPGMYQQPVAPVGMGFGAQPFQPRPQQPQDPFGPIPGPQVQLSSVSVLRGFWKLVNCKL